MRVRVNVSGSPTVQCVGTLQEGCLHVINIKYCVRSCRIGINPASSMLADGTKLKSQNRHQTVCGTVHCGSGKNL